MKVAIIGAGVSGLVHAAILQRLGYQVLLYEKEKDIAGIWATAYPEVRLQNIGQQYCVSDLPWPDSSNQHPSASQIRDYFEQLVERFELKPKLETKVHHMEELKSGWRLYLDAPGERRIMDVDFVIVATGQYSQAKASEQIPGVEDFLGDIVSERSLSSLDVFQGRKVAVVGFGKSALDLAVFAARRKAQVKHVFRTARWLLPRKFFGLVHYTYPLFSRFGSVLMPCWTHPNIAARGLHTLGAPFVSIFWWLVSGAIWRQFKSSAVGKDAAAEARIQRLCPPNPLVKDMRSAAAVAPDDYYERVAKGQIDPICGEVERVIPHGLKLKNGTEVAADILVLATGSGSPSFPFLPAAYRNILEESPSGPQLYRHIIHPRIPNLAFAGYNHSFLHIPSAEIGALWIDAMLSRRLSLPEPEEMEVAIKYIEDWKDAHIAYEPSRSCAVNTRFQQYIDIMLSELNISPYRKLPNIFAEVFGRYGPADYSGIVDEYIIKRTEPLWSSSLPT